MSFDDLKHAQNIIDTPVFCDKHRENKLEVYCIQCETAVCVLCKTFQHNDHPAEPTDEALKRLLPPFQQNLQKIEQNIKSFTRKVEDIKQEKLHITDDYTKNQAKLNTEFEEDLRQLKAKLETNSQKLAQTKNQELGECERKLSEAEGKIKEQEQVMVWMKTTLERAQGVTLLKELQDGLLQKVEEAARENATPDINADAIRMHASRCYPWKIPSSQPIEIKSLKHGLTNCDRIAILWDEVWCLKPLASEVYKYDLDLKSLETLKLHDKI